MKEKYKWGGHYYIKVSRRRYENFCRYFKKEIEYSGFMGWRDGYDWSLSSGKYAEGTYEYVNECKVCRYYFETPDPEFYINLDYIKLKNYDLNTKVPKKKPKKLTKEQKKLVKAFCDGFDEIFRQASRRIDDEE